MNEREKRGGFNPLSWEALVGNPLSYPKDVLREASVQSSMHLCAA